MRAGPQPYAIKTLNLHNTEEKGGVYILYTACVFASKVRCGLMHVMFRTQTWTRLKPLYETQWEDNYGICYTTHIIIKVIFWYIALKSRFVLWWHLCRQVATQQVCSLPHKQSNAQTQPQQHSKHSSTWSEHKVNQCEPNLITFSIKQRSKVTAVMSWPRFSDYAWQSCAFVWFLSE